MHKPCVGECVHSFLTRMRTRTHSRAQNIKMKGCKEVPANFEIIQEVIRAVETRWPMPGAVAGMRGAWRCGSAACQATFALYYRRSRWTTTTRFVCRVRPRGLRVCGTEGSGVTNAAGCATRQLVFSDGLPWPDDESVLQYSSARKFFVVGTCLC